MCVKNRKKRRSRTDEIKNEKNQRTKNSSSTSVPRFVILLNCLPHTYAYLTRSNIDDNRVLVGTIFFHTDDNMYTHRRVSSQSAVSNLVHRPDKLLARLFTAPIFIFDYLFPCCCCWRTICFDFLSFH